MFAKNVKPSVVVIGSKVVAPLEVVEVDPDNRQIKALFESGQLVEATEAETPQTIVASQKVALDAMTVAELRAYLADKGIDAPDSAKKAELLELAKGA